MTLFSSDLKLHLLHNFQQQFLSEYFNVIFAIQNAFIFIFLLRYRGSKKKSRYFSIWYTVTEYCFDSTLPDVSVIQDFKLLNKLSLQSENKLLLHGFFFLQKDILKWWEWFMYSLQKMKNVVFKISALSPEVSIYHETS